jgi:hypothetical protein
LELYKLPYAVYSQYCKVVKGNTTLSWEMAQKKLTRNIHLAFKTEIGKNRILYIYGRLHIHTIGNKIIWVQNIKSTKDWFYKDMKKYDELNEILGIK